MGSHRLVALLDRLRPDEPIPFRLSGLCNEVFCEWSVNDIQFDFQRIARGQSYAFMKREYPCYVYLSSRAVTRTEDQTMGALNAYGLPYFTTLTAAEMYFLFGGGIDISTPVRRVLQVAIDDRRAWIEKIVVSNHGLSVSLGGRITRTYEIKLVGTNPELIRVVAPRDAFDIPLAVMPRELHVYLARDNEIVDERFVSEHHVVYAATEGVKYERDERLSVEGIIRLHGEGLHHDYKEMFTERIINTVCAFANTEGGTVLVGVNDDGDVVGVENPDKIRLQIDNLIEDKMIGSVDRRYGFHTVSNRDGTDVVILALTVEAAAHRPIAIKTGNKEQYYIRRDGSNRLMRREDFARMVEKAGTQASAGLNNAFVEYSGR